MRFKNYIAFAIAASLIAGPVYAGSTSSGGSRSSYSAPSAPRSYSAPAAPSYKAPAAPTVTSTPSYKAPAAPTVAAPTPAPAYKAPAAPTVATGVAVGTGAAVAAGGASASTTAPAATVQNGTQTYKAPAAPPTASTTATPPAPSNLPSGTANKASPYTAPPAPATVAAPKPAAPTATATATPVPPKPVMSQSAQNITNARNADAIAQMKKEQAAFKAPPPKIDRKEIASNPVVNSAPRYRSYNDYTTRRTTVINQYHYTPPAYINSYAPYYGAYDTLMLTMMLQNAANNAAYAAFFHNHQNDASVQAFLAESRRNAAHEADLQNQINTLNAKLEAQKGQAVNPAYVPDDVKDVLVTPKVTVAEVADADEGGMGFLGWFLTIGLLAAFAGAGIYLVRRSKAERRAMGY